VQMATLGDCTSCLANSFELCGFCKPHSDQAILFYDLVATLCFSWMTHCLPLETYFFWDQELAEIERENNKL
jgi:hypothetical protein